MITRICFYLEIREILFQEDNRDMILVGYQSFFRYRNTQQYRKNVSKVRYRSLYQAYNGLSSQDIEIPYSL